MRCIKREIFKCDRHYPVIQDVEITINSQSHIIYENATRCVFASRISKWRLEV